MMPDASKILKIRLKVQIPGTKIWIPLPHEVDRGLIYCPVWR